MQGSPFTTQQKAAFLKRLRNSHGNVSKACKSARISRSAAYDHKKHDDVFSQAWEDVLAEVADLVEEELFKRAVIGEKGKDGIRRKSDRNLEFLAKGLRPEKYRDRLDVNAAIMGKLGINLSELSDEELRAITNGAES